MSATDSTSIRVRGSSMAPSLRDGEQVVVDLCDGRAARVGDVVLVLDREGRTVLHRVVSKSATTLTTHGDALVTSDEPVPFSRVLGIARAARRPLLARLRRLRAAL